MLDGAGVTVMLGLRATGACLLTAALLLAHPSAGEDDDFIRGYVAAVLQRDFNIGADAVTVEHGVVTVHANLSESDTARLRTAVMRIGGVQRVDIASAAPVPTAAPVEASRWAWLPRTNLFKSLIADPRWPRFGAAYQYYIDDPRFTDIAAANFGETFPIVQYNVRPGDAFQIGVQGGVFAIFNLASASFDLVNADYFAALPISYATGNFSFLFRVFHQSSHLGDEFLLDNHVKRVNLSYEAVDLLGSYEFGSGFRVYGGGGYIFDADPSDLGRGLLQGGGEYLGPAMDWGIPTRFVAATDLQLHQEGGWTPNVSPVAGLQFGSGRGEQRSIRVLLEYFNGKSPNGQFDNHHIQYVGLGTQLDF